MPGGTTSYLFSIQDDELNPPILGLIRLDRIGDERLIRAIAHCGQSRTLDAQGYQPIADRFRAFLAEPLIVRWRTSVVGVTLNFDAGELWMLFEREGDLLY